MKKVYEAPAVEKIAFQYRDQVVAASGCITIVAREEIPNTTTCDPNSNPGNEYTQNV